MILLKTKAMRIRAITVAFAAVIGLVFLLLLLFDINHTVNKSFLVYNNHQKIIADALLNDAVEQVTNEGGEIEEVIVFRIIQSFPTSSSMFCILAKNEEIVFLKDENTTSTLMDEQLNSYFDDQQVAAKDQQTYLVARSDVTYHKDQYTLVVCTRENYLIKKLQLDVLKLHALGYFIVYGVALLILNILSFYVLWSREQRITRLEQEAKQNRLVIESLENDKNRNYTNSERADELSFYDKEIVNEVIVRMPTDAKQTCIQIDIFVEHLKMEHFILITSILSRIKEGGSISCYWGENQFKVLLFHHGKEEVQRFIDLFLRKYKAESKENADELRIVASSLGVE